MTTVPASIAAILTLATAAGAVGGRPSSVAVRAEPTVCTATWHDGTRNRDVPVRIRMPDGSARVPVVLFSHGLGGSLDAGTTWGEHWSRHGFAVVHLQHPGSDASLLRTGGTIRDRAAAVRAAMSGAQLIARAADVSFVLDELARRRSEGRCNLARLDLEHVGMSGHSFGAHTTQAVSGQVYPPVAGRRTLRDARIDAAIAFSPSAPRGDSTTARAAFAEIAIPFLSITGTRDEVPQLTDQTPEERTLPFRFMPPGDRYLLVFDGADHAVFSGNAADGGDAAGSNARASRPRAAGRRAGANARDDRTDAHVREVVLPVSLDFWRATLLSDSAARSRLREPAVRTLLARGDRFESK